MNVLEEGDGNKYAILCDKGEQITLFNGVSLMTRQKKMTVCPLGGVGVGGKWKFWIWYHLLSGTKRFGELQQLLPQISRQMLTIQLRELERMRVLQRQVSVQMPPKVEYALTEFGRNSEPMLRQIYAWGRWYCEQIGLEYDWPVNDEAEEWRDWQQRTMTASNSNRGERASTPHWACG
jgi:DNA-binding HxlR family transcriptional regulator